MLRAPPATSASAVLYTSRDKVAKLTKAGDLEAATAGAVELVRAAWQRGLDAGAAPRHDFVRRLTGMSKGAIRAPDELPAYAALAVRTLEERIAVVGVVERYGTFIDVLKHTLSSAGAHDAFFDSFKASVKNKASVSTSRVLAALAADHPQLCAAHNASLSYEWDVYRAAVRVADRQCVAALGAAACRESRRRLAYER